MEAGHPALRRHNRARARRNEYTCRRVQPTSGEGNDDRGEPCHDTDMLSYTAGNDQTTSRMAVRP